MGWLSKAFGGVGDAIEDAFSAEGIVGGINGLITGGPIGAVIGMTRGGMQHHQNERAEEAQQAQLAAAQKAAELQDPSRLVTQTEAAPIVQEQQKVTEQNNATQKARKYSLSKTTYSKGLATLGGGTSHLKDILG